MSRRRIYPDQHWPSCVLPDVKRYADDHCKSRKNACDMLMDKISQEGGVICECKMENDKLLIIANSYADWLISRKIAVEQGYDINRIFRNLG